MKLPVSVPLKLRRRVENGSTETDALTSHPSCGWCRRDRVVRFGAVRAMLKLWWRLTGCASTGQSRNRFIARRWLEVERAHNTQDKVLTDAGEVDAISAELLRRLEVAITEEADAWELAAWYYEQHGDPLAAYACQRWADDLLTLEPRQCLANFLRTTRFRATARRHPSLHTETEISPS
ncbi:hypothetical protein [Fodinicola acaciae]|uniref:hypothetical protein n=1 Tax=Fodinicola acaciae TaxID=2681555 RepID=UPI0013D49BC7|nr:hypothetical protein [Fodinicola acaciae]